MTQTTESETISGGGFRVVAQAALESSVSISFLPEWRETTPFVTSQGIGVRMVPPSLIPTFQQLNDKLFVEAVFPMVDVRSTEEAQTLLVPLWTRFMEILAVREAVAEMLVKQREALPDALSHEFVLNAAKVVLGDASRRELQFSTSTYARALKLAERVNGLKPPPADLKTDTDFATIFRRAAGMHIFGVSVLLELARRATERAEPVPPWKGLFTCSLIREGALSAYAAVSHGARIRPELRRTRQTPLPADFRFEDDDFSLANLDG